MKKTEYCYDDRSFRLNVLRTTRNNGQDTLQGLNYYYDAVGNIVGEADHAQQIFYFANQEVEPVFNYTYDPLYRLLTATGREMTALQMPTHEDFPNNIPCPNPGPNAMQNYTQHYQYDALGNMLQMQSVGNWTRNYEYNNPMNNNYLLGHGGGTVYTYDLHGNMLTMPHLSNMSWDYLDQLHSASNGTFTSYYNYDAEGNRTRKVVVKNNIREERYYIGGYEVFRKYINNTLDFERKTINIADDEKVFVRIEQKTGENPVIRYQYDNHLGSACLELDELGAIISYEEYHPFGTTSYRSGRTETEVSLKRYKYCGKERDEETGLYYYGMRYYAAWLCRFVSVDPLQFKYPHYTPYQYAGNKPVTFIDLDGGEEKEPEEEKVITTTDAGHGAGNQGNAIDPGAIEGANYEKDYALKVEDQINAWLKEFGVNNMRTREGDKIVQGNKINFRWELANKNNSEVFISIHLDWSKGIDNLVAIYEPNQPNSSESQKLAESIISNSKTLIPAQKSIKSSNETHVKTIGVLREFKGKAGVLLELGSIGSELTRDIIDQKASEIGKEIAIGIYKYLFNTNPLTKAERKMKEVFNETFKKMQQNNIMQQDKTRVEKLNLIYLP